MNDTRTIATLGDFIESVDTFEYSMENFNLMKDLSELSLMELHLESCAYLFENADDLGIDTIEAFSVVTEADDAENSNGLKKAIMDRAKTTVDAFNAKATTVSGRIKQMLETVWNAIKKIFFRIVNIFTGHQEKAAEQLKRLTDVIDDLDANGIKAAGGYFSGKSFGFTVAAAEKISDKHPDTTFGTVKKAGPLVNSFKQALRKKGIQFDDKAIDNAFGILDDDSTINMPAFLEDVGTVSSKLATAVSHYTRAVWQAKSDSKNITAPLSEISAATSLIETLNQKPVAIKINNEMLSDRKATLEKLDGDFKSAIASLSKDSSGKENKLSDSKRSGGYGSGDLSKGFSELTKLVKTYQQSVSTTIKAINSVITNKKNGIGAAVKLIQDLESQAGPGSTRKAIEKRNQRQIDRGELKAESGEDLDFFDLLAISE